MILASLITLLSSQTQGLAPVAIGDKAVQPYLPTWKIPAARIKYAGTGDATALIQNGELVGKTIGLDWSEIPNLLKQAQSEPDLRWNLNVLLTGQIDAPYGIYRRTYDFNNANEELIKKELALFATMVTAYSKGKIKVRIGYTMDTDRQSVGSDIFSDYNYDGYLPEYAPATSLMILMPVLYGESKTKLDAGVPVSMVSAYPALESARPGHLARSLMNSFCDQLAISLANSGWSYGDFGKRRTSGDLFGPLTALEDIAPYTSPEVIKVLKGEVTEKPGGASTDPSALDDPFMKLPSLQPPADQHFHISSAEGGKSRVFVPLDAAKFVQSVLPNGNLAGMAGNRVVFEVPATNATTFEGLLSSPLPDNPTILPQLPIKIEFNEKEAEGLQKTGSWSGVTVADTTKGSVGQFSETGFYRYGGVQLLGVGNIPISNTKATPFLSFQIKASLKTGPLDVVVLGTKTRRKYRLFSSRENLQEKPTQVLEIQPEETFQKVTIDIRNGEEPDEQILGVGIETPPELRFRKDQQLVKFWLDDVELTDKADSVTVIASPKASAPDPRSPDPALRYAFAEQFQAGASEGDIAELRGLLADPNEEVVLAALRAVARAKVVDAEKQVADIAVTFVAEVSRQAILTLDALGTDTAKQHIKGFLTRGPFDFQRRYAAQLVGKYEPAPKPAEIVPLMVSRSWQTRLTAAEAISKLEGETAQLVAMTFLPDIDPRARVGVIRALNHKNEGVAKRLVEVAKTDPDAYVRAAAMAALLTNETKQSTAAQDLFKKAPFWDKVMLAREVGRYQGGGAILAALYDDAHWLVRREALLNMADPSSYKGKSGDARVESVFSRPEKTTEESEDSRKWKNWR